jgi:paraquat-inducible protein B
MSEEAKKTLIGAFVVGGLALAVLGVIAFGSGRMFTQTQRYIQYFDESVKGLSVGAPVMFRGVKVGTVVAVTLEGDLASMKFLVPVVTEIDTRAFELDGAGMQGLEYHQMLIARGLRAQLQMQSFVTGQLLINLDFYPGKPARMMPDRTGHLQVPTIASAAQELTRRLDELPLAEMLDRANQVLVGLNQLLQNPALQHLPGVVTGWVAETRAVIHSAGDEVKTISEEAQQTFAAETAAFAALERVLALEEGPAADLAETAGDALREAQRAFGQISKTGQTLDGALRDDRPIEEMREALRELGLAAQAVRTLADTLERHPEALLRGKKAVKGGQE